MEQGSKNGGKNGGWDAHQKLVMYELQRHGDWLEKVDRRISGLEVELATLKVKAGFLGLMGGMLPAATAVLIVILKSKI